MQSNAAQASALLKSLAHSGRLLVLCALVTRDHSAGELETITGLGQSALSQHLARLRDEEIVITRREGQRIIYSLHKAEIRVVIEALHSIYCPEL
jgi:DNA-binding transcriptional ArsR family regulator